MAVVALGTECAIVLVVLLMATDAACSQNDLCSNRGIVAIDTFKILVFAIQLEIGFIVIKIPVFPVAGVVTFLTACAERTLVHILLFMTGPAIRLGFLEYHG